MIEKHGKNAKKTKIISQKKYGIFNGLSHSHGQIERQLEKKILFNKHSLQYKRRNIINMIVKLQILSYQSRGFHKFFAQLIVAAITLMVFAEVICFRKYFRKILHVAKNFLRNFESFSRKMQKFAKKFAKSERKFLNFSAFFVQSFVR